jgi:multicomponent Na+:H+ antiporter subunit E
MVAGSDFAAPQSDVVRWRFAAHFAALALVWWLLSGGRADSWIVGAPTVVAAAALSVWLAPRHGWRWTAGGMLRFAGYFVRASLLGGVDVAWRSLHPRLPIDPQLMFYRTRLPAGTARVFFVNAISLCPGTVSADLRGETLSVHVLDGRQPTRQQLGALERSVGALFGIDLLPEPAESTR